MSLNGVLSNTLGVEVKKTVKATPKEQSVKDHAQGDSTFWNPYAPTSPYVNRKMYLEKFQRVYGEGRQKFTSAAFTILSEDDIQQYVDAVVQKGALKDVKTIGLPSGLVPTFVYSNVVKIALRVVQTALGSINGNSILGREVYLLKRPSRRSRWRVSKHHDVDQAIVRKLTDRMMKDHKDDIQKAGWSPEVQRQLYENVVTIVFRVVFDVMDSCQFRILGHTVTVNIEADADLEKAPGWDVPLEDGIFGCFDSLAKEKFVSDFADDLLNDENINMYGLPDVFEKELYSKVVMVLLMLIETACNHMRLHVAGMSFRPASDALTSSQSHDK